MKRFAAALLAAVLSLPGVWGGYGGMKSVQADTCGGPLVNLKNLKEDATYLPTEQMKTDLFAVIGVNKQFLTFNISKMKMTKADIENAEKALESYESLTQVQKSFVEEERV